MRLRFAEVDRYDGYDDSQNFTALWLTHNTGWRMQWKSKLMFAGFFAAFRCLRNRVALTYFKTS